MLEPIVFSALTIAMSALCTYAMLKKATKRENLLDISEDVIGNMLDKLTTDTEMQKQVYLLGALLGNGIRKGVGIGKTGGKFKMEDIIAQAAGGFLQNLFSKGAQPQQQQPPKPLISLNP